VAELKWLQGEVLHFLSKAYETLRSLFAFPTINGGAGEFRNLDFLLARQALYF